MTVCDTCYLKNIEQSYILVPLWINETETISCSVVTALCDPMTIDFQTPLFIEFSSQEYRSWLSFSSPGDFQNSGIEPVFPTFIIWATMEAQFQYILQLFVVQSLSSVWLCVIPWTARCLSFLSFPNSWSLLKLMSIKLMMPSNHLVLCGLLLLMPSVFPSSRVFSKESALCIR